MTPVHCPLVSHDVISHAQAFHLQLQRFTHPSLLFHTSLNNLSCFPVLYKDRGHGDYLSLFFQQGVSDIIP